MDFTAAQKTTIQNQFDCFCKRVVKYKARDRYDAEKYRSSHEIPIEELGFRELGKLYILDKPTYDNTVFEVSGHRVVVKNSRIAEALKALPENKRSIILLHYYLDMTDGEIGDCLGIVRRTVQYQRTSALKELRKMLGDDFNALYKEL